MTLARFWLAPITLSLCLLTVACDGFFDYTVVNRTQQDLLVWAMTTDCGEVIGRKGEYYQTERVAAGASLEYHVTYGPSEEHPKCLQVASLDRRLVGEVDLRDGQSGTLVVEEPLTEEQFVPEEDDLPSPPFLESLAEVAYDFFRVLIVPLVALLLIISILVGLPALLIFGLYRLGRYAWRRGGGDSHP